MVYDYFTLNPSFTSLQCIIYAYSQPALVADTGHFLPLISSVLNLTHFGAFEHVSLIYTFELLRNYFSYLHVTYNDKYNDNILNT